MNACPPVMPHIDSRRRAEAALELRAQAHTPAAISAKLGYRSREGARLAVRRLLASTRRPTVGEMRAEHREALRRIRGPPRSSWSWTRPNC
jgi:hypothetical protein